LLIAQVGKIGGLLSTQEEDKEEGENIQTSHSKKRFKKE
jgi:hypothetical protein